MILMQSNFWIASIQILGHPSHLYDALAIMQLPSVCVCFPMGVDKNSSSLFLQVWIGPNGQGACDF